MSGVDPRNFLNVSQFLTEVYRQRKASDRAFSYEKWSKQLGIKNRSYVRLIVGGKRSIPQRLMPRFEDDLQLTGDQLSHFRLLVEYSAAKTFKLKESIGHQIMLGLKKVFDRTEVARHQEFLASNILPKLLTLLSFDDLERTPSGLAPMLDLNPEELEKALKRLNEIGLAEPVDGHWRPVKRSFVVGDQLGDLGLNLFHRRSLEEAIRAQDYTPETRRYKSLLLALNDREFQQFMDALQAFVHHAIAKFDTNSMLGRRLYQFNGNLIPVSAVHEAQDQEAAAI